MSLSATNTQPFINSSETITLESLDKTSSISAELDGFSLTFRSIVTICSTPLIISCSNSKFSLPVEDLSYNYKTIRECSSLGLYFLILLGTSS